MNRSAKNSGKPPWSASGKYFVCGWDRSIFNKTAKSKNLKREILTTQNSVIVELSSENQKGMVVEMMQRMYMVMTEKKDAELGGAVLCSS